MWNNLKKIKRSGFIRGTVSLGMGFVVSNSQARPTISLFMLPVDPDLELSTTSLGPCLPACHYASSETGSKLQLNVFLYKSCYGHGVSSHQWNID